MEENPVKKKRRTVWLIVVIAICLMLLLLYLKKIDVLISFVKIAGGIILGLAGLWLLGRLGSPASKNTGARGEVTPQISEPANFTKLLSVNITTNENYEFSITLVKQIAEFKSIELIRLFLHYYAKILFVCPPDESESAKSAQILKTMVDVLLEIGIDRKTNVLKNTKIDDVVTVVPSVSEINIRAVFIEFYLIDFTQRHITTEIPNTLYMQHLVFSVAALLQYIIKELKDNEIKILNQALYKMNYYYGTGRDYSELANLSSVPTEAFMYAEFQSVVRGDSE